MRDNRQEMRKRKNILEMCNALRIQVLVVLQQLCFFDVIPEA